MAYGRILTTLCALVAFILVALHLGERLDAAKTINDLYAELAGNSGVVRPDFEEISSNGDSGRTRYLLGVGKADITG